MGLLEGKVAIVTGAGNGLGRSHALALAREGAAIVVNDLGGSRDGSGTGSTAADAVVAEIRAAGGKAVANYASVADAEGAESIAKTAMDAFGRIDIVVNNAGILRDKTFLKMTDDMWNLIVAVHMTGTYLVTRACVPHMTERGGAFINTSSYAGLKGNFGQTNYAAAKAGIWGFTQTLALELRKFGIRANTIAPIAKTRMTEDIDMIAADLTPEMVSPMVVYLASDLAKDVTGRTFGCHGPELIEYKMMMTPGAKRADGKWTAEEIAKRLPEIEKLEVGAPAPAAGADLAKVGDVIARLGERIRALQPAQAAAGLDELARLLGGGGAPSPAPAAAKPMSDAELIDALFSRIGEGFKPDKGAGWKANLIFDIKGTGEYSVAIADGKVTSQKGRAGEPTCVITFADAATYLGVARGQTKAEQAFMAGKIKANNMADLMKFGQAFDLQRAQKELAAATAAAPAGAAAAQAAAKPPTDEEACDEIFKRIHEGFLPEKAGAWKANIVFDIKGVGEYTVIVADGKASSTKGRSGEPTCVITWADAATYLGTVKGTVKPEQAFMAGKIKATSLPDLMKFSQAFDTKRGQKEFAAREAALASGAPPSAAPAAAAAPPEGTNRKAVGKRFKAPAFFVEPDQIVAYAKATKDENPRYLAEKDRIAPPIFAVRCFHRILGQAVVDPELNADLLRLVHGEQEMIFHHPLHSWDLVNPRAEIAAIEEKSSGQIIRIGLKLWVDGELAVEAASGLFIRGAKKAEKGADAAPAAEPASTGPEVLNATDSLEPWQPKAYAEASLDDNPIHTDEGTAKAAGHPTVIGHGLCTMAMVQRAVVNQLCGGDPTRLKRLSVRFSKVVLPNDQLTIRGWAAREEKGIRTVAIEVTNQRGEKVITNAAADFS